MTAIAKGSASNPSNPVLTAYVHRAGALCTPYSLAFQIFDVSTDAKQAAPVQVYPPVVGEEQIIDPVADKIDEGRFVARWSVAALYSGAGRHAIRWYVQLDEGGPEYTTIEEFDVLASVGLKGQRGYALVSDVRGEGYSDTTAYPDARIIGAIERASKMIDRYTRQWFELRELELAVDGCGAGSLCLDVPLAALRGVRMAGESTDIPSSSLRVYNRHVARGLTMPDDRRDPKITWSADGYGYGRATWERGTQNVIVRGVFGFVDPSEPGSMAFVGRTPEAIRRATILLAIRELPKLSETDDRFDARERYRIKSESTRDQSYSLGPGRSEIATGDWTGDPEIDDVIADHLAPFRMAAT